MAKSKPSKTTLDTAPTPDNAPDDLPVAPDVSLQDAETPLSLESAGLDVETANAVQTRATGRSVAKATAGIVPIYMLRFICGFVANPLIARNLGLSPQADAYAVATDFLQRIWLIFEKVVNPAVMPCFIGALKEEGEERAWRFLSTVFWLTVILLFGATALAWWQMPLIIGYYSQKSLSDPQKMALTISTARLLLFGLLFLGLSSLTYVILNGYKRFIVAALGDTMWKVGVLMGAIVAIVLHKRAELALPGMEPAQRAVAEQAMVEQALLCIVGGFLAGAFLKLLPQVIALGRKWKFLRFHIDFNDPLTRKMLALSVPLIVGIMVSELRGIYLQRLADSHLIVDTDAGRAALKWSRTIGDSLVQIFPYALSIGIFPYLADLARERDRQPLTDTLMGALRVCIFAFGPLTAILIALKLPLLRAVWESGRFSLNDTHVISGPFIGFTIGLIGFSCEMILNQTFYAMTNAWTPTLMGLASTVIWIVIATLGIDNGYGLTAIAAAESIAKTSKCLMMWWFLRPHLGDVKARENLVFCFKVACGSILAAAVAWAVAQGIAPQSSDIPQFKIKMMLAVTAAGCSGMVIYIALGAIAGVKEVREVFSSVGKLRKKLAR